MKTSDIKVSILMPSLNVAQYIGQCIESVTRQTLKEIEIICIDAESSDGTREIIDDYARADERITVINSKIKSYGHQMNIGINAARGEYIGIIETDDFVDNSAFEDLYKIAVDNGADMVRANYFEYSDETGSKFFDNTKLKNDKKGLPTYTVFNANKYPGLLLQSKSIWSGIYKKEFLNSNNIRFLESKGASYQDIGFFIKTCLCAKRVVLTDKAYLHYRMDNMTSSINSGDKIYAVCNEHNDLSEFIKNNKLGNSRDINRVLIATKIGDYLWNFQRIQDDEKIKFIETMKSDFCDVPLDEIFKNKFLSDQDKKDMTLILNNPEGYVRYRKTFASRFAHCADDNGLLYTLKYMTSKMTK